jgi:hypothetical protein
VASHIPKNCVAFVDKVGHDISVGIATRYGLDGPGIESRLGRDFPPSSRPTLGPTQPPIQWGKAAGAWCSAPTPSSAGVKERVQLYLYSLYGPSWPVIGQSLFYLYPYLR